MCSNVKITINDFEFTCEELAHQMYKACFYFYRYFGKAEQRNLLRGQQVAIPPLAVYNKENHLEEDETWFNILQNFILERIYYPKEYKEEGRMFIVDGQIKSIYYDIVIDGYTLNLFADGRLLYAVVEDIKHVFDKHFPYLERHLFLKRIEILYDFILPATLIESFIEHVEGDEYVNLISDLYAKWYENKKESWAKEFDIAL